VLLVGLRCFVNKPFGALGGYIDIAASAAAPSRLGFRAYLLAGLLVGGLLYAVTLGSWAPSFTYPDIEGPTAGSVVRQAILLVVAGGLMGFGARTAGGCTSGHGLCGMSLGSPASAVSTMTFFATAVALAEAFRWIGGER
jgi:uncharacterized membrane protein YedE/YeeE